MATTSDRVQTRPSDRKETAMTTKGRPPLTDDELLNHLPLHVHPDTDVDGLLDMLREKL